MRNVVVLLIFMSGFLFMTCSENQNDKSNKDKLKASDTGQKPALSFAPNHYVCYKTNQALNIDGVLDEEAWAKAEWTVYFKDIEGDAKPEPRFRTRVKMLWDEDYLYISAELEEPEIWANLRQRDTVIFYDNDFEVFIDPDGDTHNYYEFEMNAFSTEWDLLLSKPYRDGGPAINGWDINGMKTGVKVYGTINDPENKDEKWTLEIAMPWNILKECALEGRKPNDGDQWRINFSRVEWTTDIVNGKYVKRKDPATGKSLPEDNWVWSPQGVINMHVPESWGIMQFSDNVAGGEKAEYVVNQNENIKWELRKVYKAQNAYRDENGKYSSSVEQLGLSLKDFPLSEQLPFIQITDNLYEITLPSVNEGKFLHIRQDGKVWEK
ncbi:MAG: hypothetical protein J7L04_12085 [Bacteroidales bacterium]|nr:hypothetical protein [Bacteroidales bacterium]